MSSDNGIYFVAACTNGDVHLVESKFGNVSQTLQRDRSSESSMKMGICVRFCIHLCSSGHVYEFLLNSFVCNVVQTLDMFVLVVPPVKLKCGSVILQKALVNFTPTFQIPLSQ